MTQTGMITLGEVGLKSGAMTTLGHRIKAAREREHMTGLQLARRLGVSKNTISNWENGSVPKNRLAAIRDVLPTFNPDDDEPLTRPASPSVTDDLESLTDAQLWAQSRAIMSVIERRHLAATAAADATRRPGDLKSPPPAQLGQSHLKRADRGEMEG